MRSATTTKQSNNKQAHTKQSNQKSNQARKAHTPHAHKHHSVQSSQENRITSMDFPPLDSSFDSPINTKSNQKAVQKSAHQSQSQQLQTQQTHTPQQPIQDYATQDYTIEIGKLGRTIGLQGAMALYSSSDFVAFLQVGLRLFSHKHKQYLTLQSITHKKTHILVRFAEIDSRELAQSFVNTTLFTTKQHTREHCELGEDEFFYFDVMGLEVIEDGEVLGRVCDIERIGGTDYLHIALESHIESSLTQADLTQNANFTHKSSHKSRHSKAPKPKTYLLPYIDAYVLAIHLPQAASRAGVFTRNAKVLFAHM